MIRSAIANATIQPLGNRWIVRHPSNDAILAYADTEAEAVRFRDALDALSAACEAGQSRDNG